MNISFGRSSVMVSESDGEFSMCIIKNRNTIVPITASISSTPGSAARGVGE